MRRKVHHVEYPEIDPHGIAHVIKLSPNQFSTASHLHSNCQFGKHKLHRRSVRSHFLNGEKATRIEFVCTGVKLCQYADPYLTELSYLEVTNELWEDLKIRSATSYERDLDGLYQNATETRAMVAAIRRLFWKMGQAANLCAGMDIRCIKESRGMVCSS